jgi:tRNA A-37 threonylcarbamoyl transferase component Bud32
MATQSSNEYYVKENVSLKEYQIHQHVYDLNIVNIPKIISYNEKTKQMTMIKVGKMNVADFYGELAEYISDELFYRIRQIIQTLYDNGILYVDITGYNFIEDKDKLWIIDFEHATLNPKTKDDFVERFLQGANQWNPEFY